jgi:hypothetical protein
MDRWAEELVAKQNAPEKPYLTDTWKPIDENLWGIVLEVAKGKRREFTRVGPKGPRTIHAPNHGLGFRHWPSPKATAWAIKQYKGFGGGWKDRHDKEGTSHEYSRAVLDSMKMGALITTKRGSQEHGFMLELERQALVDPVRQHGTEHIWDITARGRKAFTEGLGGDLEQKMDQLLDGEYDLTEAKRLGTWLESNFRFKSPKTPPGQKVLKKEVDALWWYLAHGGGSYRASIQNSWEQIKPRVADLVRYFTDEGGTIVPPQLALGSNIYVNKAGLDANTLAKYAKRFESVFADLQGWRQKALKGGVGVTFASPKDFNGGHAAGRYKTDQDTLLVRTTPAILKRDHGYAGFEYIIVHELGHRYARYNALPVDFDRPEWQTTKYSAVDGEAFAELFAIGHYRMKGAWDPEVLSRFERVML